MPSTLIVALDLKDDTQAFQIMDKLDPSSCALKVGSEMFTRFGPLFVKQIIDKGFRVFLDLKFHDIPNTVAAACKSAADLGVWMVNVHAAGGLRMMEAANNVIASYGKQRPILIAVTVLTSMDQADLLEQGIECTPNQQVLKLAKMAHASELDGVVCSSHEARDIKQAVGPHFITVTPGIRLLDDSANDQRRVMTPDKAIQAGSDYLVVGRSITNARDPHQAVMNVLELISQGKDA
jgi:orotidine-5'-phosphate decarboxylase